MRRFWKPAALLGVPAPLALAGRGQGDGAEPAQAGQAKDTKDKIEVRMAGGFTPSYFGGEMEG